MLTISFGDSEASWTGAASRRTTGAASLGTGGGAGRLSTAAI